MDTINITITGFPNAGKSTITNSFIGSTCSKINTDHISKFCVGNHKTFTNFNEIDDSIKNELDIFLPYPKNFQLKKDLNYKFSDCEGIINETISSDSTYKYIKRDKIGHDVLIVVFDINKFSEDEDKNLDLLKRMSARADKDGLSKLLVVLNKCDSILDADDDIFKDDKEFDKYESICKILKDNNYNNIFALCAKGAMLISSGDNDIFANESSRKIYTIEKKIADDKSSLLFAKYGFSKLTSFINNFVLENKENFINKYVMFNLKYQKFNNFKELLLELDKMKPFIGNIEAIQNRIAKIVMGFIDNISHDTTTIDINNIRKDVDKVCEMYLKTFGTYLDKNNTFGNKLEEIEFAQLKIKLNNGWDAKIIDELYKKNKLSDALFFDLISSHITKNNIMGAVQEISELTNHNPIYMYNVVSAFIKKNNDYLISFKYGAIRDPLFDWIRLKLLNEYGELNFDSVKEDFLKYKEIKIFFTTLNKTFFLLGEHNESITKQINESKIDDESIEDENNNETSFDEISDETTVDEISDETTVDEISTNNSVDNIVTIVDTSTDLLASK